MGRPIRKVKANLFFIEIIIVLLFFSISGVTVLSMFAQADTLEHKTSLAERAVLHAQSVSEIYAETGDVNKALDTVFGRGYSLDLLNGTHFVCLDENLHPLMTSDARINYGRMYVRTYETRTRGKCGEFCELETSLMFADEAEFYSLKSSVYIPDTAGGDSDV